MGGEAKTLCIDMIEPYTSSARTLSHLQCSIVWHSSIQLLDGSKLSKKVPNKQANEIANLIEQTWFSHYPWLCQVILDRGKEFMAEVKTLLRHEYRITQKPITTHNPQVNAMVKHAHQTLHNMTWSKWIHTRADLLDGWAGILSAVGFTMHTTVHTTNHAMASQLVFVFHWEAMHNVGFQVD